jgi:hypothetical protein
MTLKDVALYCYLNICLKNLPKNYIYIVLIYKDLLQGLMSVFKYTMFILFIPNHTTRFQNIHATYSCKQINHFQHSIKF